MAYLSLYRKWRSQSFADVVGQTHIVQTLKNSLNTGRITHAYLFTGPRGTGKTTLARLFAKGLNCSTGPTSDFCNDCEECQAITRGNSLNVVEIDGASNRGIEEIRELREQVRYAASAGKYKVYIIDEVHMLTTEAFNALLKTLEEPPERVVFILATTDPQKIPPTILSRCQRYDFKRFAVNEIAEHLHYVLTKEGVSFSRDALELVAEHADGGMRDALGIVDQCMSYSDQINEDVVSDVLGVTTKDALHNFLTSLDQKDGAGLIAQINDLYVAGKNLGQFVRDILSMLQKAILQPDALSGIGLAWDNGKILQLMEVFAECERDMRYVNDYNIPIELAVLKVINEPANQGELEAKVKDLEEQIAKLRQEGTTISNAMAQAAAQPSQQSTEDKQIFLSANKDDEARLDTIRGNWQEYLSTLHDERLVQPEAFLREGHPIHVHGDTITISFPPGRGFHKASIEQDNHREPAERVLSKFFGTTLNIRCIISTAEPEQAQVTSSESKQEKQEDNIIKVSNKETEQETDAKTEYDESVEAALRLFGGTVIDIKNNKKGGE